MADSSTDNPSVPEQVRRAAEGDRQAWADLLNAHRPRLRRMVALRLDRRLQGRLDPSDVIQEAYLDAARRLRGGIIPMNIHRERKRLFVKLFRRAA